MINTVLQTIERFESSMGYEETPNFDLSSELETSVLPTPALENYESDDASVHIDTEEDTSDDSVDFRDILGSVVGETVTSPTDPGHIKQTLKDKIRFRRESEGAGELINLFEPPVQYQLTEEEERKNELRKQRNRRSANKSRLKRIAYEKKLEQDAGDLEKEHSKLKKEVEEMKTVKLLYSQILKHHMLTSCPRVTEALKQRLILLMSKSSVMSLRNESASLNSDHMSANQILTSQQNPQLSRYSPQPPNYHSGMKRNITDGASLHPVKVPKLWDPLQPSTFNPQTAQVTTQTCINNGFDESLQRNVSSFSQTSGCDITESMSVPTRFCNQDNVQCETPVTCTAIQTPLSGSNSFHAPPAYTSVAPSSDRLVRKDLKINATDAQKINQIKEHLLDGFKVDNDR